MSSSNDNGHQFSSYINSSFAMKTMLLLELKWLLIKMVTSNERTKWCSKMMIRSLVYSFFLRWAIFVAPGTRFVLFVTTGFFTVRHVLSTQNEFLQTRVFKNGTIMSCKCGFTESNKTETYHFYHKERGAVSRTKMTDQSHVRDEKIKHTMPQGDWQRRREMCHLANLQAVYFSRVSTNKPFAICFNHFGDDLCGIRILSTAQHSNSFRICNHEISRPTCLVANYNLGFYFALTCATVTEFRMCNTYMCDSWPQNHLADANEQMTHRRRNRKI